jgi:formate/nitrite transporter FocA (FNT family)
VFPLFILQPSLGLGFGSSKTPKPAQARLKSLVTHVVFGVGLYLCAMALSHLPIDV